LALDEAPRSVVERLGARLETGGDVRERVAALEADDAEILAAHPAEAALAIVRARVRAAEDAARPPSRGWWWASVPVLAGSLAVVAVMVRSPEPIDELGEIDPVTIDHGGMRVVPDERTSAIDPPQVDPPQVDPPVVKPVPAKPEDGVRLKGQRAHLVIHRRESDGPVRLEEEAEVHADDLLQVGYVASGRKYGVIVSIDGAGAVTLHWPDAVDESTALEQGEVVALAHSYELDDAPEFERFVLVTSNDPIDAAVVVKAAERIADSPKRARSKRLPVPTSWQQSSILLRKAPP
ncbi:MAG TPA: hypothetical protein VFG69_12410, partial [Nannocystaceae bacterium]|nr:hypothetical protein [Nannocystaceae bacterium]